MTVTCAILAISSIFFVDIRERFFYVVLVSMVALRNMQELQWNLGNNPIRA